MSFVLMIVVAAFVFGAVIFVHELGHFAVAKWSGIKVNEFAMGMGPTIYKVKKGETTYALRLLPIGGFVSMEGEDEESQDERSYQQAKVWRRFLVIIAGAVMNIVLGFFACLLLVSLGAGLELPTAALIALIVMGVLAVAVIILAVLKKLGAKKAALITAGLALAAFFTLTSFGGRGMLASRTIAVFEEGASTEATGLQVGDTITKVNGRTAFIYSDLLYEFARTQNGTVNLTVKRDGQDVELKGVVFQTQEVADEDTGETYTTMTRDFKVKGIEKNFFTLTREAANTTISFARLVYLGLFDLITGNAAVNQLTGPVGIVSEIGKAVSYGWQSVAQILALISVNLGVVNMLPLPALDGSKALLLIVEGIRRKPLNPKYEIAINATGFVLLMLLMLLVSFNDIRRLFF